MKKLILNLIIFILSSIVSSTNYCKLEKLCLNGERHVGCEINEPAILFDVEPMTDKLRELILNRLNDFRNDIANGLFEHKGLPKASNMRMLKWNYEFEYLSGQSIKIQMTDDTNACFITEQFKTPWNIGTRSNTVVTTETIETLIIGSVNSLLFDSLKMEKRSGFYNAENNQVGCSFGKQIDESEIILECYFNARDSPITEFVYDHGEPCTKCGIWNEKCDHGKYSGLCVSNEIPEKGVKGDSGDLVMYGEIGMDGPFGYPGRYGIKGISGDDGFKGVNGEMGDMGLIGMKGTENCECKMNGENIVKGEKGDFGKFGLHGFRGPFGDPGSKGERGIIGTPGLMGLKGDSGFDGEPGVMGYPGRPGMKGRPGLDCVCQEILQSISAEPLVSVSCDLNDYPDTHWVTYSIIISGAILLLTIIVARIFFKKLDLLITKFEGEQKDKKSIIYVKY